MARINFALLFILLSITVVNAQDRMTKRDELDHINNRNHTSVGDINRIHYQSGGWQSRLFFESQDVNRSHLTAGELKSLSNSLVGVFH